MSQGQAPSDKNQEQRPKFCVEIYHLLIRASLSIGYKQCKVVQQSKVLRFLLSTRD